MRHVGVEDAAFANTLWAFAKVGIQDVAVIEAEPSKVRETERKLCARATKNTVWALAMVEVYVEPSRKAAKSRARETLWVFRS